MLSNPFFTDSRDLPVHTDGRREYLQHGGETFLRSLAAVGRSVAEAPVDDRELKANYLTHLASINDRYFDAREFEDAQRGKFYKYDDDAERGLRTAVAEGTSDCVADLRDLSEAHATLLDAALDRVNEEREAGPEQDRTREAVETKFVGCTNRVVRDGWFPTLESYHRALNPGERVAEGKERQKQRLEGQESIPGVGQLLDGPAFRKLERADLERIRRMDRESPEDRWNGDRRLVEKYDWLMASSAEGADDSLGEEGQS